MFHSFLSDDNKKYAATNTSHGKHLIELLKEQKLLMSTLSTLWVNTDGLHSNIDVPQHYTLCKFCPFFSQL